jgi:anthranilate synthase component 1
MLSESIAADEAALLALAEAHPDEFPVLFDSAAAGPLARWTLLAAFPEGLLRLRGDGQLEAQGLPVPALPEAEFLTTLEAWWRHESLPRTPAPDWPDGEAPPFRGGWAVFLAYEAMREIEPRLRMARAADDATVALALRIPALVACDRQRGRCWLLAEAGRAELLPRLRERLAAVVTTAATVGAAEAPGASDRPEWGAVEEEPSGLFLQAVHQARERIAAGDLYQANLSRGWRAPLGPSFRPASLYRRLRHANPAPFAAWWQHPYCELLSSSPERLVRTRGTRIDTRPIAGTRPRRGDAAGAVGELAALLASPKERAEHIMLIDLERNDLGRVCAAGSVRVDEWMVTESYAHVHHIVSNVTGTLRPEVTPVAVLRALFPGGTITGCPKYRCMELIAALEAAPRGGYTGSVGYINRDGDLDFNILIRTLCVAGDRDGAAGRWLTLRAGAGIVADSDPERELHETRAKALGLLRALGAA